MLQPDAFAAVSHNAPYEVLRDALAPHLSSLGDSTKDFSLRDSSRSDPPIAELVNDLPALLLGEVL